MIECTLGTIPDTKVVCHTDDHPLSKFSDGSYTNHIETLRVDLQSANAREYRQYWQKQRQKKKHTKPHTTYPTNPIDLVAEQDSAQSLLEPQHVP